MKRLQKTSEIELDKFLESAEFIGDNRTSMWKSHTTKGTLVIIHQVEENEYVILVDTNIFINGDTLNKLDDSLIKTFGKVNRFEQSTCEFVINNKNEYDNLLKVVAEFNL